MKKMIVINLFGGEGCGKSTGASYIFARLKMEGVDCELVTEFAKDKTWEKATKVFNNQAYIFGKQYYRLSRLEGEVDIVITDSPLLLSIVYNNNPNLGADFCRTVYNVFDSYDNINYYLNRVKPFKQNGRWRNEERAKEIDIEIKDMLKYYEVDYKTIDGDISGYDIIVENILKLLQGGNK